MEEPAHHALYLTPEFVGRLRSLAAAAAHDPNAAKAQQQAMRLIRDLQDATEIGHHPLTDKSAYGRGDLRDCTASEFRSRDHAKLDHRVIWRQLPGRGPAQEPIRELIHIGPRHETPDTYDHTLSILERAPHQQISANQVYGDVEYAGNKPEVIRSAALRDQHAVSLARPGVAPLTKSRPLHEYEFGGRNAIGMSHSKGLSKQGPQLN